MAHFGILCPNDAGHLLPVGSLGRALALRGHRVTILGAPQSAGVAQQLNLPLVELTSEGISGPFSWPLWLAFHLFDAGGSIRLRDRFCRTAKMLLKVAPARLKELALDGLLIDQDFVGGGTLAESLDLPFVTVCSSLPWHGETRLPPSFTPWQYAAGRRAEMRNRLGYAQWRWYMHPVLRIVNRYRHARKLPPRKRPEDEFSPLAQICQLCPEIDFPRGELPSCFHYTGPLGAVRPGGDGGFPWHRLDGRPLIFASLGTVPDPLNPPVFRRILAACANGDAQLVLALGRWNDQQDSMREALGEIPGDPVVVEFAPQLALLDRAALLITHAGLNTTMEALSRGVPIAALPRGADQPGMAARIEYAGVGLRASFYRSTAPQVRTMVQHMLSDDRFRQRAKELQSAIGAAGGVQRAAEIAEQALLTGCPVPRDAWRPEFTEGRRAPA